MTVANRPTLRERNERIKAEAREETRIAIAEGRVTIRQMTAAEHAEADARQVVREAARAARPAKTGR